MHYRWNLRKDDPLAEDKVFNLDRFAPSWREFEEAKALLKKTKKAADEFGRLFKELAGDARVFKIKGQEVAKVVEGQLNKTLLAKEQPDIVKRHTKVIAVERFDEDEFREQEPQLYAQYRARRLVLSGDTE